MSISNGRSWLMVADNRHEQCAKFDKLAVLPPSANYRMQNQYHISILKYRICELLKQFVVLVLPVVLFLIQ